MYKFNVGDKVKIKDEFMPVIERLRDGECAHLGKDSMVFTPSMRTVIQSNDNVLTISYCQKSLDGSHYVYRVEESEQGYYWDGRWFELVTKTNTPKLPKFPVGSKVVIHPDYLGAVQRIAWTRRSGNLISGDPGIHEYMADLIMENKYLTVTGHRERYGETVYHMWDDDKRNIWDEQWLKLYTGEVEVEVISNEIPEEIENLSNYLTYKFGIDAALDVRDYESVELCVNKLKELESAVK